MSLSHGPVARHLQEWAQNCPETELFPLTHFLVSCVERLVSRAAAPGAAACASEDQWRALSRLLTEVCDAQIQSLLCLLSPASEVRPAPELDPESFIKALEVAEPPPVRESRGTACKWSDGIAAAAQRLPPDPAHATGREFYAAEYRPPPLLDALRELELEHAHGYHLCTDCHVITSDIAKHYATSGTCGLSPPRAPTVDDLVRKCVAFAQARLVDGPPELQALDMDGVVVLCSQQSGLEVTCPGPGGSELTFLLPQLPPRFECCVAVGRLVMIPCTRVP